MPAADIDTHTAGHIRDKVYMDDGVVTSKTREQMEKTISRMVVIPGSAIIMVVVEAEAIYTPALHSFIGDSECVIAFANKTGAGVKPCNANRAGKLDVLIKEARRQAKVRHLLTVVPRHENPAGLGTGRKIATEGMSSQFWQKGPKWLREPRYQWPLRAKLAKGIPREQATASCRRPVALVRNSSPGLDYRHQGLPALVLGYCTHLGTCLVSKENSRPVRYLPGASYYTCFGSKACAFDLSTGRSAEALLRVHGCFTETFEVSSEVDLLPFASVEPPHAFPEWLGVRQPPPLHSGSHPSPPKAKKIKTRTNLTS